MDCSKRTTRSSRHWPEFDAGRINRAVERVARGDDAFVEHAIGSLEGLQFPAFKHNILTHVHKITADPDIVSLFESLNGYVKFKDAYHVQKAIEENGMKYKVQNQMTDKTRLKPNFRSRSGTGGASTKAKETVSRSEEREDYPEITPTAASDYVCDFCGKAFQNQDDLVRHQRFESGVAA
jgi:hypothetical protein